MKLDLKFDNFQLIFVKNEVQIPNSYFKLHMNILISLEYNKLTKDKQV